MKQELRNKVDSMLELYSDIKTDVKWAADLSKHFAALTYTLKEKDFEKSKIESMKKLIKKETGMFSPYRGNSLFILPMLLCCEFDNPEKEFLKMMDYHELFKSKGFKDSSYLPLANYALLLTCPDNRVKERIHRAYDIFSEMKKNHPWLTSGDDYPLAVLLSASAEPISTNIKKIEDIYTKLNQEGFSKSNGLQFLSHILSFGDESIHTKVERCVSLNETLKNNKLRIYSSYYASLGIITLINKNNPEIVNDLIDVANYMRGLKKYKWLGKEMNVLLASGIVCSDYIQKSLQNEELVSTVLGISLEAIIAAQTAALIASCSAASVAAASASST